MYKVVDISNSTSLDKLIIKTNLIEELILVQHSKKEDTLFGLFLLEDDKVVLIKSGNMSFYSTHGGMMVLKDFRKWLNKNNINKRTLKFTEVDNYQEMLLQINIKKDIFLDNGSEVIKNKFNNWLNGKESW